ncbi:DnaB-like helicase C-terminal domain-containing protein [Altererythrobacter sp. Root672]|uniref:DnaB-like helicase C-terminal domain-containing protein n=1 Tax=Altererythrobacter sp. Root672 TaxID=1736584 RepID=UPI0006F25E32|nr:DnaB-like helicase C-terminal domain-containing protein [Altererythrobacter sp. Root672]KRA84223.1 hypothetical protein ASD76_09625 [Altererythrobacter sp. Root672]
MLNEKHQQWLAARGLDPELAMQFGLTSHLIKGGQWLSVPYRLGGKVVNHKHRNTERKDHQMDPGARLVLWNAEALTRPEVLSGQESVVITEGEWDALAAIQAGYPATVSVPNGAPAEASDDPDAAKRYDWARTHRAALYDVQEFILACDADGPGYLLLQDLVRLLGAERCRLVRYPAGCKDLGDVLAVEGVAGVTRCLDCANPYPVQGLYRLSDFPERGEVVSYSTGVAGLDDLMRIVPGTLTVLTGYANAGKSTLMTPIIAHALRHHFPVCVASFETMPKPVLRDHLRAAVLGCGIHELGGKFLDEVDALLEERLVIVAQMVDEEEEFTLEHFLGLCEMAVLQYGVRMVVLDPWNELEHRRRPDETETEYIGRANRAIKQFARRYDVSFWVVAHPTKPPPDRQSGPPGLYAISGSANWANKADYGLTYHRANPEENAAEVIVSKVRMGMPGRRGRLKLTFDHRISAFRVLGRLEAVR